MKGRVRNEGREGRREITGRTMKKMEGRWWQMVTSGGRWWKAVANSDSMVANGCSAVEGGGKVVAAW